jgi:hypothetical protein
MEIRTGIDLKRSKLAMDLNLGGEITESTPVADVVWMRHKLTSEKMKLNGNDFPSYSGMCASLSQLAYPGKPMRVQRPLS